MMYYLALWMRDYISAFNVMRYVTFRVSASLLTALVISLILGPWFIRLLSRYFSAGVREFTPQTHQHKGSTPTMGGLLILGVVWATLLLWGNWHYAGLWVLLLAMTLFAAIGFWDDYAKVFHKRGINARTKFLLQVGAGLLTFAVWYWLLHPDTQVWLPFFKNVHPELGLFFILWVLLVLIGTCNAVNLTDGLDGLAATPLIANFLTFTIIAYCAGHIKIANYLAIPFVQSAELAVVGAALAGATVGFLWFNTYPAQIFMGDVGSLSLGAALGIMALMVKQELLLPISGGLFLIEALSVIIQVLSFKLRGKRIFKMAPLHHHYELLGWPEAKITVRFGIISFMLCLLVLMTLKLR